MRSRRNLLPQKIGSEAVGDQMYDLEIYVHSITEGSRVNGPGERTVVHFQGCEIQCPGCFSPHTWRYKGVDPMPVSRVIERIISSNMDLTVSGGEPLEQLAALTALIEAVRAQAFEKTILLFTGFSPTHLKTSGILKLLGGLGVDLVIAGPFDKDLTDGVSDLRGSSNQEFLFLSDRITKDDVSSREVEVLIDKQGKATLTGFPKPELGAAMKRAFR